MRVQPGGGQRGALRCTQRKAQAEHAGQAQHTGSQATHLANATKGQATATRASSLGALEKVVWVHLLAVR